MPSNFPIYMIFLFCLVLFCRHKPKSNAKTHLAKKTKKKKGEGKKKILFEVLLSSSSSAKCVAINKCKSKKTLRWVIPIYSLNLYNIYIYIYIWGKKRCYCIWNLVIFALYFFFFKPIIDYSITLSFECS